VKCGKCGKKLADHAGVTRDEFPSPARAAGCSPPEAGGLSVTVAQDSPQYLATDRARTRTFRDRANQIAGRRAVNRAWEVAAERSAASEATRGTANAAPTAYPPGNCAAQKCVLRTIEDGGSAKAICEMSYSSARAAMGSPIRYIDASNPRNRVIVNRTFGDRQTVPPCAACEVMLPMLLCTDNVSKGPCNHRN
jgi:hypothetical protein